MNKKRHFLLSAVLATTLAANAQVTINVDASNPGVKVSPNLYGIPKIRNYHPIHD